MRHEYPGTSCRPAAYIHPARSVAQSYKSLMWWRAEGMRRAKSVKSAIEPLWLAAAGGAHCGARRGLYAYICCVIWAACSRRRRERERKREMLSA